MGTPLDGASRGSANYEAIGSERGVLVESLRRIPFFRQLGPSVVRSMTHTLEVIRFLGREVLWDYKRWLSKEVGHEHGLASDNQNATYLHVLIRGKAWAFKKDFNGNEFGGFGGLGGFAIVWSLEWPPGMACTMSTPSAKEWKPQNRKFQP